MAGKKLQIRCDIYNCTLPGTKYTRWWKCLLLLFRHPFAVILKATERDNAFQLFNRNPSASLIKLSYEFRCFWIPTTHSLSDDLNEMCRSKAVVLCHLFVAHLFAASPPLSAIPQNCEMLHMRLQLWRPMRESFHVSEGWELLHRATLRRIERNLLVHWLLEFELFWSLYKLDP